MAEAKAAVVDDQETVISTPSTKAAAAKMGVPEEEFLSQLAKTIQAGTEAGIDAGLKRADGRRTEKRPSMEGMSDQEILTKKAWEITEDDSEKFKRAKAFLPAGCTSKMSTNQRNAIFADVDRTFYRNVDLNDFPKGTIEENFSLLRLLAAQNAFRNGDTDAYNKIAPWEHAYYQAVSKAQAESNGQDGGFLAPETWV